MVIWLSTCLYEFHVFWQLNHITARSREGMEMCMYLFIAFGLWKAKVLQVLKFYLFTGQDGKRETLSVFATKVCPLFSIQLRCFGL